MSNCKSFNSNETNVCADCGQTDPTWASINHGVLICDQCAIIHRGLGRFISQVKPLKCSNWKPSQLQMVFDLYRNGANSIWEHTLLDPHLLSSSSNVMKGFSSQSGFRIKKPQPNDSLSVKGDFIRSKYQAYAYVNKSHKDGPETEADISEQLHSAARTPNLKTSLRLLAAGANPNYIHSEKFNTPLHMAAKSGQISQIELLLVYGANMTLLDRNRSSAIDYARQAGHIDILNRLIEHQFDLTDCLTRYICLGRTPNHVNGEHFLIVDIKPDCLNSDNSEDKKTQAMFRNELHQSISSLCHKSFEELTRDIYDEIDRRETNAFVVAQYGKGNGKLSTSHQQLILPFLPVFQFYTSTRNQGRQKLALLNTKEFTLLIVDVLNEIRRRIYGLNPVENLRIDGYTNVTGKYTDEFDDDSEPLYDSVPSEPEGDYDECNELVPPIVSTNQGRVSSSTLVTSNSSASGPDEKNFVSMNEYAVLKEQMLRSANLMEQFFNENKEMRTEIQRLQGVVERLVDENAQLRQIMMHSPKQSSSNSLNHESKSNSGMFDSSSDHLNRNSFLRGSGSRVRPQSISYTNSVTNNNNNRYSNECISLKAPSNVISHSLSHSPSKSSNCSLLNFQAQSQVQLPPAPPQQPSGQQVPQHSSLNMGSTSNSSSSSLSSQPLLNNNHHHQLPSSAQQYLGQMPYLAASSSDPNSTHFSGLNLPPAPAPLTKSHSMPTTSTLPSKEDVIKKIEFITNSIKELLSNAREGKHDEFSVCSERICNSVSEMITLFPESLGAAKVDSLLQVNQALAVLQEKALLLHEECNSYELNALLGIHPKPQLNSSQDYRFIYNNVIDKAADVASSVKVIVSHYSC